MRIRRHRYSTEIIVNLIHAADPGSIPEAYGTLSISRYSFGHFSSQMTPVSSSGPCEDYLEGPPFCTKKGKKVIVGMLKFAIKDNQYYVLIPHKTRKS